MIKDHNNMEVAPIPEQDSSSEEETLDEIKHYDGNDTELQTFTSQASGHSAIFKVGDSKIAKPCNPHEALVYEALSQNEIMKPFVPKFYGVMNATTELAKVRDFQIEGEFIVLEDITSSFHHACVLDLKLGKKNYYQQHSTEEKRLRKIKQTASTAAKLGLRLSGIRTYKPSLNSYAVRKRKYGNRLTEETFLDALDFFLNDGLRIHIELLPKFLQKLEALLAALKKQGSFDFIASSLLLVYEGDYQFVKKEAPISSVDLRLIDFDHAIIREKESHDDESGVIAGVQSLVDIIKRLMFRNNHTYSFVDFPINAKNLKELGTETLKRADSMPEFSSTEEIEKK